MTPDTTVSVALIFSLISAVGVGVSIWSNIKRDREDERTRQDTVTKSFVEFNVKLDNFREDMQNTLAGLDSTNREIKAMSEQIVRMSEQINNLYHYKTCQDKRISALEQEVMSKHEH